MAVVKVAVEDAEFTIVLAQQHEGTSRLQSENTKQVICIFIIEAYETFGSETEK